MVQECMTFLDATPDLDSKVALIKTLVTVSAGKARRYAVAHLFACAPHADGANARAVLPRPPPPCARVALRSSWRLSARG
jgi:hypothetical protein